MLSLLLTSSSVIDNMFHAQTEVIHIMELSEDHIHEVDSTFIPELDGNVVFSQHRQRKYMLLLPFDNFEVHPPIFRK